MPTRTKSNSKPNLHFPMTSKTQYHIIYPIASTFFLFFCTGKEVWVKEEWNADVKKYALSVWKIIKIFIIYCRFCHLKETTFACHGDIRVKKKALHNLLLLKLEQLTINRKTKLSFWLWDIKDKPNKILIGGKVLPQV